MQKLKAGKHLYRNDHLNFKYKFSKITTSDSLVYEGAISEYIFLYDLKDSSTEVYPVRQIEELVIK